MSAITWKRREIRCKLALPTNRKLHDKGFRLVQKSVTLNDLELRNDRVISAVSLSYLFLNCCYSVT